MNKEDFDNLHDLFTNHITGLYRNYDASIISRLFNLHNKVFPPNYSQSCSACREQVYRRMKEYWEGNKQNFGY